MEGLILIAVIVIVVGYYLIYDWRNFCKPKCTCPAGWDPAKLLVMEWIVKDWWKSYTGLDRSDLGFIYQGPGFWPKGPCEHCPVHSQKAIRAANPEWSK